MIGLEKYLPKRGYVFERPTVILQSDDWGLVGVRDAQGAEELGQKGVVRGNSAYDNYTLETAEDVRRLINVLESHRDETGRAACMVFNFITANVDFGRALENGLGIETLVQLADGFPAGWERPGLLEAYREGIARGVIYPALHGVTHFNLNAAKRLLGADTPAGAKLRALYASGTPLLPELQGLLGFEYYDPGDGKGEWLDADEQRRWIGLGAKFFLQAFGVKAVSACAPGYRANAATRRAWRENGIAVAQNGPGNELLPHRDRSGVWMLYRTVELEPALHPDRTDEHVQGQVERAVKRGEPIVVSIHSVNFHSTLKNYRDETLARLDRLLEYLERRLPNLRYMHDGDLVARLEAGANGTAGGLTEVEVRGRWQLPARLKR